MKAINIAVDISKLNKIEDYVRRINSNEELAACPAGKGEICVVAVGERGIAYAEALATEVFDSCIFVKRIK